MQRVILGFDTSAINALLRDGLSAEPLLAGLSVGYALRLNATSLDEIVAHGTLAERERLRTICRRMLANGESDVLQPYHEITKRLPKCPVQNRMRRIRMIRLIPPMG